MNLKKYRPLFKLMFNVLENTMEIKLFFKCKLYNLEGINNFIVLIIANKNYILYSSKSFLNHRMMGIKNIRKLFGFRSFFF